MCLHFHRVVSDRAVLGNCSVEGAGDVLWWAASSHVPWSECSHLCDTEQLLVCCVPAWPSGREEVRGYSSWVPSLIAAGLGTPSMENVFNVVTVCFSLPFIAPR